MDASNTGIGAILSQRQGNSANLYPCAYYSRKLNAAERNYDVGGREPLAMKAAFDERRHWLEGAKLPFIVLTDHRNLEYIRSAKRLNTRQARWSLFSSRFDFHVTYRPGSKNGKADALLRQFDFAMSSKVPNEPVIPTSLILAPVQWDIITEITDAQANDPKPPDCPPNLTYVPAHPTDDSRFSQFWSSWDHSHGSSRYQPVLVAIVTKGRYHVYPTLCYLQYCQIVLSMPSWVTSTSTYTLTPLVSHRHRLCN